MNTYANGNPSAAPFNNTNAQNQGEGANLPNKKKSSQPIPNKDIESHITDRYEILKRVGKGAYGIVWKAIDKRSGKLCALKKIFEAFRNHTDAQRTYREISFLREFCRHENIVKLLNVKEAMNNNDIYLTFEYMESDLHTVIRTGILEESHKPYIIHQILKAVKYLHSGKVIHRDLKPSNILINESVVIKICDFGLARSLKTNTRTKTGQNRKQLTEYVATRWYRAPEILLSSPNYSYGVDIWSIGCITGELFKGKPIFPGKDTLNQIEEIVQYVKFPSDEDIHTLSSDYGINILRDAKKKLQCGKLHSRNFEDLFVKHKSSNQNSSRAHAAAAAATQIQQNQSKTHQNQLYKAIDFMKKVLVFNIETRADINQLLDHPYVSEWRMIDRRKQMEGKIIMDDIGRDVTLEIPDDEQQSVQHYKETIYKEIEQHRYNIREKHRQLQNSRPDYNRARTEVPRNGAGEPAQEIGNYYNNLKVNRENSNSGMPRQRIEDLNDKSAHTPPNQRTRYSSGGASKNHTKPADNQKSRDYNHNVVTSQKHQRQENGTDNSKSNRSYTQIYENRRTKSAVTASQAARQPSHQTNGHGNHATNATIAKAKYNTSFNTILEPNQHCSQASQHNPDVVIYDPTKYRNQSQTQNQTHGTHTQTSTLNAKKAGKPTNPNTQVQTHNATRSDYNAMSNIGYGNQYNSPSMSRQLAENYDSSYQNRNMQRSYTQVPNGGNQKPNINVPGQSPGQNYLSSAGGPNPPHRNSSMLAPSETSLPMSQYQGAAGYGRGHSQGQAPGYQGRQAATGQHAQQTSFHSQTHSHPIMHHSSQMAGLEVQGQLVNLNIGDGSNNNNISNHSNATNNYKNTPDSGISIVRSPGNTRPVNTRSNTNINNISSKKLFNNKAQHQSVNDGVRNKMGSYDQGYGVINQSSMAGLKKIGGASQVQQGFYN